MSSEGEKKNQTIQQPFKMNTKILNFMAFVDSQTLSLLTVAS